jgi:hypothetical protein
MTTYIYQKLLCLSHLTDFFLLNFSSRKSFVKYHNPKQKIPFSHIQKVETKSKTAICTIDHFYKKAFYYNNFTLNQTVLKKP